MGRLENKVAVITGSGRGLGLTTAALFSREGAQVVVADLDPARAAAVSEQIAVEGGEATAFVADLSYPQGAEEMAAAAIRAYAASTSWSTTRLCSPPRRSPRSPARTTSASSTSMSAARCSPCRRWHGT